MASKVCGNFWANITRVKTISVSDGSQLQQRLNTFELTLLGVGSMAGAGLYVLTGVVANTTSGPAILVSYLIAGFVALLAALCYAELAGKIPRTGSAYTFIYVAMGECWAFFIGWNMLLEYILSCASVSRAMSSYVDRLCDNAISNFTIEYLMGGEQWDVPYITEYPDLLAVVIEIFITIFVILGVSFSSWTNSVFLSVNTLILLIIFGFGMRFADISNWTDNFAPHGAEGVIEGAAMVFFSFIGFDTIAICNEEAKNAKKSIPVATFAAVCITVVMYIMGSAALTLMVPYSRIDVDASFPSALAAHGVTWGRWVLSIGAISGMLTTLIGSILPLSRCVYAIADDGLLFQFLAKINDRTKTPVNATVLSMILSILLTLFFSLSQLVHFLSIGTLCAYAFVAGTVIVLRYKPNQLTLENTQSEPEQYSVAYEADQHKLKLMNKAIANKNDGLASGEDDKQRLMQQHFSQTGNVTGTLKERYRNIPIVKHLARFSPGRCVVISLFISLAFQVCAVALVEHGSTHLLAGDWWAICLLTLSAVGAVLSFLIIPMHHQETMSKEYFNVKYVPLTPCASILADIILLVRLEPVAWLRYLVWLAVGAVVYFTYGYRNSNLAVKQSSHKNDGGPVSYGSLLPHQD